MVQLLVVNHLKTKMKVIVHELQNLKYAVVFACVYICIAVPEVTSIDIQMLKFYRQGYRY